MTFDEMLAEFRGFTRAAYRSDPERTAAVLDGIEITLERMLERFAESERQQINAQAQRMTQAQ